MELEITPEPSEEERAAIAAALLQETEERRALRPPEPLPDGDPPFEP
jgi:hypothetical protein